MTHHQHEHDQEQAKTAGQPGEREQRTPDALQFEAAAHGRPEALGGLGMLGLQRAVGNAAVRETIQRSPVLDVVAGGGRALDEPVRQDMEARLGADFSEVRIHDDAAAHASAKSVSAHAYTVGNRIVFQHDAYAPGTAAGDRTLAHELTHVIQQRSGPVEGTPAGNGVSISDPSDRFEREAEANAERVMGQSAPAVRSTASPAERATGPQLQRAVLQREAEGPEEAEEAAESAQLQRRASVQREAAAADEPAEADD